MTPEERAEIKQRHAADARRDTWTGPVDLFESFQQAHADRRALLDALAEVEAVYQAEVARLRKQIEDEPPEEDLDYMCPNCVTPWKCNGPHVVKAD